MAETNISIRTYRPTDIKSIVKMHQDLYEAEYGFDRKLFGEYVEKYARLFEESRDKNKGNIWIAEIGNRKVGTIALVKTDDTVAQLRWFLVEPEARGHKIGHKLLRILLDFAKDKQYENIFLWTIDNLEAARYLYGCYGFTLTETQTSDLWGTRVNEERWDLDLR